MSPDQQPLYSEDDLILARGQFFLGRTREQVKEFLTSMGIPSEASDRLVKRVFGEKKVGKTLANIIWIVTGSVLAVISILLLKVGLRERSNAALVPLLLLGPAFAMLIAGVSGLIRKR